MWRSLLNLAEGELSGQVKIVDAEAIIQQQTEAVQIRSRCLSVCGYNTSIQDNPNIKIIKDC